MKWVLMLLVLLLVSWGSVRVLSQDSNNWQKVCLFYVKPDTLGWKQIDGDTVKWKGDTIYLDKIRVPVRETVFVEARVPAGFDCSHQWQVFQPTENVCIKLGENKLRINQYVLDSLLQFEEETEDVP